MGAITYIEVVVPLALPYDTLSYSTTEKVEAGQRVLVRVGAIPKVVGIVRRVGVEPPSGIKVQGIKEVLDGCSVVREREWRMVEWMAEYYMCRLSDMVKIVWGVYFSVEFKALKSARKRKAVKAKKEVEQLPITLPKDKPTVLLHTLSKVKLSAIVEQFAHGEGTVLVVCPTHREAKAAQEELSDHYDTTLYCNELTMKKRATIALNLAMGTATKIVVGTRAALGLSYPQLDGVVLLNEASYYHRSGTMPFISGRECALMLAAIHGARCTVVSDMPSVESYYNAHYGQWGYQTTAIPSEPLKSIVLERGRDMISKYAKEAIAGTLEVGKRSVVLQNRRGVASYLECTRCGDIPQCPNCSVSLTLHTGYLGCHYCGHREEIIEKCPECGGLLERRGRGTQQIFEQLCELYPTARIVRLDGDSFRSDGEESSKIMEGEGDFDIVVGTNLMLDGTLWDNIGVVAVLNVDNMLSAADFRVEQEAFKTLWAMARFCKENSAELIIQSSKLDHRVVERVLEEDFEEFYKEQLVERKALNYPPYTRLLMLEIRGENLDNVLRYSTMIERTLRHIFHDRLSGIYQPTVERQRGEHITNMMLKIERSESLKRAKEVVLNATKGSAPMRGVTLRAYNL